MRIISRSLRLSALSFLIALAPLSVSAAVVPVNILDGSFSPQGVSVNPGDTVVWTNYGSLAHTVVSTAGLFQSASIPQGANFSYTFNAPGTFGYYDSNYSSMTGSVGVAGSTGSVIPTYTASQTTNTTAAGNSAALQAQAQALLQEISQLQAQLGSSGSTATVSNTAVNSSGCPNIGRTLKLGSSGSDVARLQQFLAQYPSIYPSGIVSGYYGALTQAAVEAWQVKYNIVSSGTPSTTGFGVVGPRTAAAIALLCSTNTTGTTGTGSVSTQAPQVSGSIQVTPISGTAPLSVTVQATINLLSSCSAATYVLNFGDGTQSTAIPIVAGVCTPQTQVLSHTYATAGTYTIVLAASGHQTTAAVTVAQGSSSTATSSLPADSIQASITVGAAPLSVVFTGTVSSLANYGCASTCTDTINFGDGTIGLVQIPTQSGTWQSYIINHTYTAAGTYVARLQTPTGALDANPITIVATGASSGTTTTSGGSYGIISVTPNVGGNPLAVSANVALPTCAPYQMNWGDNSAISTQTAACQNGGSTVVLSHTYASGGTYTISLNDGNGAKQSSAQISITH